MLIFFAIIGVICSIVGFLVFSFGVFIYIDDKIDERRMNKLTKKWENDVYGPKRTEPLNYFGSNESGTL